ncbi:hypothetical protein E2L08_01080 [Palleronia sediminis]|uniref:Uncharacterized protein n=1 Tax=Palleronia sediminis TaxID=2547833 RepID=A0A4R6APZ1_9RHOB|nr:hypothetical protein [Palleronia sediminis]TDL84096.1 hypothetical protein E2L08_01080 [Palleronia sediminis]
MPLDRFVLILVCVVIAAGLTVWVGAILAASVAMPLTLAALLPLSLVLYVVWRVIAQRLSNREDDRYDRTPR